MLKKDLSQLFEETYHIQNCELALGEYYQQLAAVFPDQRWFWEEAVSEEVDHARKIGKLIAMVSSDPSKFELGRYRVAALETFLNGIYANIEKAKKNTLSRAELLKIAFDYENSIIETKPCEVVTSSDPKFQEFKNELTTEIGVHSAKLRQYAQQRIALVNQESASTSQGSRS